MTSRTARESSNMKIQGAPDWFEASICWGSLVPLGGNQGEE